MSHCVQNEQISRDAAGKKRANTSGVGKITVLKYGRQFWRVGGIYGCGWLVGVVVRRYKILTIIINFSYSTCISSFFASSIPTSLFIF